MYCWPVSGYDAYVICTQKLRYVFKLIIAVSPAPAGLSVVKFKILQYIQDLFFMIKQNRIIVKLIFLLSLQYLYTWQNILQSFFRKTTDLVDKTVNHAPIHKLMLATSESLTVQKRLCTHLLINGRTLIATLILSVVGDAISKY